MRIAFLVPSLASGNVAIWRLALEKASEDFNARVRTFMYVHWDDQIILETARGFDCVFLNPSAENIPIHVIKQLKEFGNSVFILDQDLTMHGLASVYLFPSYIVQKLLDILGEAGHRTVDCFNIQPIETVISGRIEQWNLWRSIHKIKGRLLGEPLAFYSFPDTPFSWAYKQMMEIIRLGQLRSSALFCTTAPAAIGAIRAMYENNIKIGQEVHICVVNDEGYARYTIPSITSVEMPDPTPYIRMCLERMQKPEDKWYGPLLIQPVNFEIFVGESTGKISNTASRPQ